MPGAHTRREIDRVCRAGDNTTSIHRLVSYGNGHGIDRALIVHVPEQAVMVRGKDGRLRSTADIPVPRGQMPGVQAYLGHLFLEAKNLWIRAVG